MGEAAVPVAMASPKRGSYFARHWRGELSLPKSYWLNGVLLFGLGCNLILLVAATIAIIALRNAPAAAYAAAGAYVALNGACWVWAIVGIWRSAGKYKGAAFWRILARILILLGVVVTAANIARTFATVHAVTQAAQQGGYTFEP